MTTESAQPKPRPARFRRLRILTRVALALFAVLVLLATVAFWAATRSWFIIWQITPVLEDRIGGEVRIGRAEYRGDGRIIFSDIAIEARGIAGPAAEVARIHRATVSVALNRLLPFSLSITDFEIDESTLRVSENEQDGRLNLLALDPKPRVRKTEKQPPPRILLRRGAIEFGRHSGEQFDLVDTRLFSGDMRPAPGESHFFNFNLIEVDGRGVPRGDGLRLVGDLDVAANQWRAYLGELELNERIHRVTPQIVQNLWTNMDLQGKVKNVEAVWSSAQSFAFRLDVENVNLTLPVEPTIDWARYRAGKIESTSSRPRLHFDAGTIIVTAQSLRLLKLTGELESAGDEAPIGPLVNVPYEISFVMEPLPPLDWQNPDRWVNQIVKEAPFDLEFQVKELNFKASASGEASAVDLPLVVARTLEKFGVAECILSTRVVVSRHATEEGGASATPKTTASGHAFLSRASGRYRKFPYPLDNVDAYLQFNQEKVIVHYLNGTGSGNSKFRISGEITPPDNDAAVSLHLVGTDVPVDDRLRAALDGGELEAFDMFFGRETFDEMNAARMIPDEAALASARALQDELAAQRAGAETRGDHDAARELQARINRLQASLDAGPFVLGGLIDVDLRIERPQGRRQSTIATGVIDVQNIGLLYEKFPYPVRFTSGRLNWLHDRVVAAPAPGTSAPGPVFVTPAGGRGILTGEVEIIRRKEARDKVRPSLEISVIDDEYNPAIAASIDNGLARNDRSQPAEPNADGAAQAADALSPGDFVRHLGLNGPFDWHGTVRPSDQDRVEYLFVISLKDGRADLAPELARVIGATGKDWPRDFKMAQLSGDVRVRREGVALEKIAATVPGLGPDAAFTLDGHYTWRRTAEMREAGSKYSFNGTLAQSLLEAPLVLDLMKLFATPRVIETYQSSEPVGLFDAAFALASSADQGGEEQMAAVRAPDWRFTFKPRTIGLTWRDRPIAASFEDWQNGGFEFTPNLLTVREIYGRHDRGEFRLNGTVNLQAPIDLNMQIMHLGQLRSDPVEAFLPKGVLQALDAIKFQDVNTRLDNCVLQMTQLDGAADLESNQWRTQFNGPIRLSLASFDAGVKFIDVSGTVQVDVERAPDQPLRLNMLADLDEARVLGQFLKQPQATLAMSDDGGTLIMPDFRAYAGDGVVSAIATAGVGSHTEYQVAVNMAAVPLQGFSFATGSPPPEPRRNGEPAVFGDLHASVSLSGQRGVPESRRGRAIMRVLNGQLANVPLAMQLLQLMQFTASLGTLDSADADMHIFGDRLFFAPINFEATRGNMLLLQMSGEGEMNIETMELSNMRFRSRGSVPLLRDIVGELANRLYVIEVSGPLHDPKARLVPLPAGN